ncbi:endonuclease V [Reichenbachiella versicolor]|uniref:endonuclease V n=1 Tax=Reichenbachiella versicolor TaxID=1821036 RepID=UPI000D6DE100|nr:endonuclease V [Reichenbachiella versicolor]
MIYCFDTFYREDCAKTAVVGIEDWYSPEPAFELTDTISEVNDYESGAFYKRELPCLLSIIDKINLDPLKDILVIDGYVFLSDEGKIGLGGYLYNELKTKVPIIGVAKNNFFTLNKLKKTIFRGGSKKPLFITVLGFDLQIASEKIISMHGDFRMPTILKLVDQKCRDISSQ